MSGNDKAITSGSASESNVLLQRCFSSIMNLVKEKEDEIKALRSAHHAEMVERKRLECEMHSMELTNELLIRQIRQLEFDASMAPTASALNQLSLSSDQSRAEMEGVQLMHAADLENVRHGDRSDAASSTTVSRVLAAQLWKRSSEPRMVAPTLYPLTGSTSDDSAQANREVSEQSTVTNKVDDWSTIHDDKISARNREVGDHDDDHDDHPSEISTIVGEGHVRVCNKPLVDCYGKEGLYTGVIMSTTKMPHGAGRMDYVVPGRTYDGEWQHGQW